MMMIVKLTFKILNEVLRPVPLVLSLALLTPQTSIAASACESLFILSPEENAPSLLYTFGPKQKIEIATLLRHNGLYSGVQNLNDSDYFKIFIRNNNLPRPQLEIRESDQSRNTVVRYLHWVFEYFHQNLAKLQSASLLKNLRFHGYTPPAGTPGRAALRDLSATNVERILNGQTYRSSPEMSGAEQLVADLEFDFIHNTRNEGTHNIQTPLLSTDLLKKIGFTGGKNTNPFNRQFLHTHDQVFFYVKPVTRNFRFRPSSSYYGDIALFLHPEFAESAGWISAFIMYTPQLFTATKAVAPAETDSIVQKYKKTFSSSVALAKDPDNLMSWIDYVSSWELKKFFRDNGKELESLRHELHKLDFTVSDFTRLVRVRLLISLQELQKTDEGRFRSALQILRSEPKVDSSDKSDLERLVQELVFRPLGMPSSFELKVPWMVPAGEYMLPN